MIRTSARMHANRLWCAIALSCYFVPSIAQASLVFGHVSGGGFTPRDTFRVQGKVVGTNERGDFKVVLAPGAYVVTFVDKQGVIWVAAISSDSGPLHQDINFRRK